MQTNFIVTRSRSAAAAQQPSSQEHTTSLRRRPAPKDADRVEARTPRPVVSAAQTLSFEHLHEQVGTLARNAGHIALQWQAKTLDTSYKDSIEPVTRGDKETERYLTTWIGKQYPSHGILGEESGSNGEWEDAPMRWLLDPIDGTTNYMRHHPFWSVLIAVQQKTASSEYETIVGAVYAPKEDALFTAFQGGGSFLNGRPIRVSQIENLQRSLLSTDYAYEDKKLADHSNDQSFVAMRSLCQNVHVTGSSGLNLAYVAAGRYDAFWHRSLKPWDMAAGALLVEEAGGTVTGLFGNDFDVMGKNIVATNGVLHKPCQELVRKSL